MAKRSFSEYNQEKVSCWSSENDVGPGEVHYGSNTKFKFNCNKCDHSFYASPIRITNSNTWCPFCSDQKLCDDNSCVTCFEKSFEYAEPEKSLCWSHENPDLPHRVFPNTSRKFLFDCDKCPHTFSMPLRYITGKDKGWCVYCAGRKLCEDLSCTVCFERTFAFAEPEKSLCWSSKNVTTPGKVFKSCNKKFLFDCSECGHDFASSPNRITGVGSWCPYCDNKLLCGEESCTVCPVKTFQFHHPEKAACWSSKNEKLSTEVLKSTAVKYLFDCGECSHEFLISPHKISGFGRWCPYCTNQKLCGSQECVSCYEKTFEFHEPRKALCWSPKNDKLPREVFRCSDLKCKFVCGQCSAEFSMILANISRRGSWCPSCAPASHNVVAIQSKLGTLVEITTEREVTVRCNGRSLFWDFVVKLGSRTFHIENDGSQHFYKSNFGLLLRIKDPQILHEKFKDQRVRDLLKEEHIKKTNGLLFRISYRQLKSIDSLVINMIAECKSGRRGVVYMDTLYEECWGPIE